MREDVETRFRRAAPAAEFCSLRFVETRGESIAALRGVVQPVRAALDAGAMVTVIDGGGLGYAATSDLSEAGLRAAGQRALDWARLTRDRSVACFAPPAEPAPRGSFASTVAEPWTALPLAERIGLVERECERLKSDARIVDWGAGLYHEEEDVLYLTADGGRIDQRFTLLYPSLHATANEKGETQTRTLGGGALGKQGGLELLDDFGFREAAPRIAAQALELIAAPNCPTDTRDLLLAPDQVYIQIHESIGHPLELDRILGDERNYAGTSFVTADMFGRYRYGSELLNVTFDPTLAEQIASYAFDDEGQPARREYVIREGVLLRALGSATSQARAGLPGVANARACSWNRPPIDRMANLNLEPGDTAFDDLVASVERGVYMETNRSWSIDDSRNKFQFGCEWARLIESGELGPVVRNPNYRGISAEFWRSLTGVGNRDTFQVLGTPTCGKGEPNQAIRVGHAAPACLFRDVEVFGGA